MLASMSRFAGASCSWPDARRMRVWTSAGPFRHCAQSEWRGTPLSLQAEGDWPATRSTLRYSRPTSLDWTVAAAEFPPSGPDYLNALRFLDVPQAVAMAAERCSMRLHASFGARLDLPQASPQRWLEPAVWRCWKRQTDRRTKDRQSELRSREHAPRVWLTRLASSVLRSVGAGTRNDFTPSMFPEGAENRRRGACAFSGQLRSAVQTISRTNGDAAGGAWLISKAVRTRCSTASAPTRCRRELEPAGAAERLAGLPVHQRRPTDRRRPPASDVHHRVRDDLADDSRVAAAMKPERRSGLAHDGRGVVEASWRSHAARSPLGGQQLIPLAPRFAGGQAAAAGHALRRGRGRGSAPADGRHSRSRVREVLGPRLRDRRRSPSLPAVAGARPAACSCP